MAHTVPTRTFLKPSPTMAMVFAPFGCIYLPLGLSCSFLLAENLIVSPKEIAGRDITITSSNGFFSY